MWLTILQGTYFTYDYNRDTKCDLINFNETCLLQKFKYYKPINSKIYHYGGLYQKL